MCGRCCVRGSVSGSVVNVIIARYLLVYKHTSPPPGAGRTPSPGSTLAALLADNKVLLFHAAYILMLALIGNLATSTYLLRILWLSPPRITRRYSSLYIYNIIFRISEFNLAAAMASKTRMER